MRRYFLLLFTAVLAGCASTPSIDTTKPVDPAEVMRRVDERNAQIKAIEGYGKLAIDSPEISNSGAIEVTLLKPDSLQIEINGPFGVTVVRAMMTNSAFTFYDGLKNTVAMGETSPQNLRRILPLSLSFEDILDMLSGTLGFGMAPQNVRPACVLDGSLYAMAWTTETERFEYVVNLDYLAVQSFIRRDGQGVILEEVSFRDFRRKSGLYMPQIVSIARPGHEESLSLVYDSQVINDLPIEFDFSYPRSARKISF